MEGIGHPPDNSAVRLPSWQPRGRPKTHRRLANLLFKWKHPPTNPLRPLRIPLSLPPKPPLFARAGPPQAPLLSPLRIPPIQSPPRVAETVLKGGKTERDFALEKDLKTV